MDENRTRHKKKRRLKGARLIPVLIAVVLIIIVIAVFYGEKIIAKYSYSTEYKDLNEYFELFSTQEVAMILQDEHIGNKALMKDGNCYFDMDTVEELFVQRFYVNEEEKIICYTTADEVITAYIASEITSYQKGENTIDFGYPVAFAENDKIYLAVDYVKLFADFSYELYENPYHMVVYTEWGTKQMADVNKENQVRYKGGVKSPILRDVAKGESLYVLEEMEDWCKVRTTDGFIGYIEKKRLENYRDVAQTPEDSVGELQINGIHKDYKINMAFHQVFAQTGNDTFDSYCADVSGVNVIAPTWFRLIDAEGNIENLANADYVQKAHDRGMEVWAVLTDVDYETDLGSLFSSSAKRDTLINNLITAITSYGIDGINIDIEHVQPQNGDDFIQFIRELSIATRNSGVVLSIDNYAPTASTMHYNRAEQGVYADYVIVMGYDEHWGGGGVAGSVASIGFVQNGITNTLAEVPASKVINAIPFYTRLWKTENGTVTGEALGMDAAKQRIADAGATATWDEETCQNYAEFTQGTTLYQVWLEDTDSIEAKLNVMNVNQLAGVAEWKLGFENADVWPLLQNYVSQP